MQKFFYVDLAEGKTARRQFDGMKAGKFTSMDGRGVEFLPADMGAFLEGTKAAIEATRSETGVIVGLPIDMKNHDHGNAAGWITDAALAGDVMRFTADWTQAGADLIGAGLQRFFSPSVDMQNKAIIGGSLTNWPATRANGKTLLRPIELSTGVYSLETSLDERLSMIYEAFDKQFNQASMDPNAAPAKDSEDMGMTYEIEEVFDGYVITKECATEKLFRATFTEDPAVGVKFQAQPEWTEVKITYEDVTAANPADAPADPNAAPADATPAPAPVAAASIPQSTPALAELSETQIAALVDERVNVRIAELARKADRERDTLAFSEKICNGTKETPIGLAVPPAELCAILLDLPDEGAAKVKTLLEHVARVGVVNFSERGHSQITENKPELTGDAARLLKTWVKSGREVAEFFSVNPELKLNPADYNLSEFQKGKI
jgi:hypothetical protein